MTTLASPVTVAFSHDWAKLYPSAKVSGIVGNIAHTQRGGYHESREDNPHGNYSIVRPDDLYGPGDLSAAVDMTLNAADMKRCTARLVTAYAVLDDPRRKYLNAFNGTIDGRSARRWDVYARTVKIASPDHLWHVHLEIRRRYVTSPVAMKALLSLLGGEKLPAYLDSIGVRVPAAHFVSAPRNVPPSFPGTLRRDDHQQKLNLSVRRVQVQLRARGWTSQGPSDGFFGAKLEATVKRWQRSYGLSVDGVIGPKTWATFWTRPVVAV